MTASAPHVPAVAAELRPCQVGWWSCVPHFMGTPGYVDADASGRPLGHLIVDERDERDGDTFVPAPSTSCAPAARVRRRSPARPSVSTSPTRCAGTAVSVS